MKTKTINIYEFKELKPKIQEKVISYFQENEEFHFLNDMLKDELEESLRKNKIEELDKTELSYSLSSCQGDGLSFTGFFRWKGYLIKIERDNFQYSHKYTTDIMINKDNENALEGKEKVYNEFKEIYFSICNELEKYGYSLINDALSESAIKEQIEMNEYMFRENGEIENE